MMTQTIPHKASSDLVDNFIFDSFGNAPIQSLQDKEEFHIFEHLLAHIDYYMCHRKLRAQLDKVDK